MNSQPPNYDPQQQWGQPQQQQDPYQQNLYGYAPPPKQGQSRAGIGGIVAFALAIPAYIVMVVIAAGMDANVDPNPEDPMVMLMGFAVIAGMGLNILGMILGFFGFIETTRHKMTAWIAILLNVFPCLGCAGLMALGLLAGGGGF